VTTGEPQVWTPGSGLAAQAPDRIDAARDRLARTGRTQLHYLLDDRYARHLKSEAEAVDYNVVTLRGTGHVDLPAAWLASLEPRHKEGLGQAIQAHATGQFQYLYDNHPIYDLNAAGRAAPVWSDLVSFLSGAPFLNLMREVTGEPRIAQADAQLTRFRPGHFLTTHDDHAEGKSRYFAYVLGLSEGWRIDWGGLLAFHDAEGNVAEAFTPRFNTLNLLKVPQPHSVTQVALSAGANRISITGWLRGAG
jgi:hypothetical protein